MPAKNVVKLPDGIAFDTGAAMMLKGLTAQYLLKKTLPVVGLQKGDHVQVFVAPARFPFEGIDWAKCIVYENAQFAVAHKPGAVPVHATPDNARENLLFQLRRALGKALLITQRLDTPVEGLVVLARTMEFQRHFNALLAERAVGKRYRALLVKAPKPGVLTHYMDPSEKTPRQVSAEAKPGWLPCELEIRWVRQRMLPSSPRPFVEVEVQLITGRTHQIRAQLAAVGCPIVGDKLYGSTVRYSKLKFGRGIALCSQTVRWPREDSGNWEFSLSPPWGEGP
jgi:23S rRNA-/tRNA-specific pseudouridylate synthase